MNIRREKMITRKVKIQKEETKAVVELVSDTTDRVDLIINGRFVAAIYVDSHGRGMFHLNSREKLDEGFRFDANTPAGSTLLYHVDEQP